MPINPPTSTLQTIQTKVRRLTRSPSTAQLSDDDLNQYINTFVVYNFPEQLRTFNLRQQFTFYTQPGQDVYPTDILSFGGASQADLNPLFDFQNKYLTIHPPVYIAGYQQFYTQSREQFFGIYPIVRSIASIGKTGDGLTTQFSGVININGAILNPGINQQAFLLQNQVLFSSVDVNLNGLAMIDSPILDATTGNPTNFGVLYPQNNKPAGLPLLCNPPYTDPLVNPQFAPYVNNVVNYFTGAFTVNFPTAPANGLLINSQAVPSVASIPQALLFYQNQFTVRPIPDQPYAINFEVFKNPVALLAENQQPELNEYWEYISYGAARKIFQDRMDLESVALIEPEFKLQERLCLRRSLVQWTNERTATIYTEQVSFGPNNGLYGWGSGPF